MRPLASAFPAISWKRVKSHSDEGAGRLGARVLSSVHNGIWSVSFRLGSSFPTQHSRKQRNHEKHHRTTQPGSPGCPGLILGSALALGFASPALALETPREPAAIEASERAAQTTFTPDLQTEIEIGDESRPSDFIASADGAWGFAAGDELSELVIIDMAARAVADRIPFPGEGAEYVRLSPDGSLAYFAISTNDLTTGIGVVDLTTRTLIDVFTTVPNDIQGDRDLA